MVVVGFGWVRQSRIVEDRCGGVRQSRIVEDRCGWVRFRKGIHMAELQTKKAIRWSKTTVNILRDRFKQIRHEKGQLTARLVLEDARNEDSPIHRFFDWNDRTAAEKYRLEQASNLIRQVQIMVRIDHEDRPMREFLCVVKDGDSQYLPYQEVKQNRSFREQVLERAKQDLEGWIERYDTYEAVLGTPFNLVKEAVKKWPKKLHVKSR